MSQDGTDERPGIARQPRVGAEARAYAGYRCWGDEPDGTDERPGMGPAAESRVPEREKLTSQIIGPARDGGERVAPPLGEALSRQA